MFLHLRNTICGLVLLVGTAMSVWAEPLTRRSAIEIAMTHNLEVATAYQVWQSDQARALQSQALPDPELSLEYEGLPGAFSLGSFGERTFGLEQKFEFPVKWWLRGLSVGRQAQSTRLGVYETVKRDVALQVLLAYERVVADEQIVRFVRESEALAKQLMTRAEKRFRAGDVPRLDVMRAEVLVLRQQNRLLDAQNNAAVSRTKLNSVLGQSVGSPIILADSLRYDVVDYDVDVLCAQALKLRPEILGAERAYASARSGRLLASASLLPDVSVGIARQTVNELAGKQKFWRTGFAIELPVWGLFRQRGEIVEASAREAQARLERDRVKLQVVADVHQAFGDLNTAAKRAEGMLQHILATAQAAYVMAQRSYDEGKASYLDLIEAQRDLIETQAEYVEILYAYRVAHARLMWASGNDLMIGELEK